MIISEPGPFLALHAQFPGRPRSWERDAHLLEGRPQFTVELIVRQSDCRIGDSSVLWPACAYNEPIRPRSSQRREEEKNCEPRHPTAAPYRPRSFLRRK